MICIDDADAFRQCFTTARDWIQTVRPFIEFGLGLLGVGSAVSIGVLTWYLRKSRGDIVGHQNSEQALRIAAREASEARQKAEENERALKLSFNRALEELERTRGPADEKYRLLHADNIKLFNKLEALRLSSEGDGAEFWSREVDLTKRIADYEKLLKNSIPVVIFANQKGGVGKTTLSVNLAACFAERGERVLVIDLDYQGSATGLMLAQSGARPDEFPSMVDLLFADELNTLWPGTAIQSAHNNLDYVACWYSFERLERNLEYRWALGDSIDDIRYRLARVILSPYVQQTYKRVIIDAPPRMTAGFVNGLCASTHLFVPTVVDSVSAAAVGVFSRQFKRLSDSVNTVLELSGVVGTMTDQSKLPKAKAEAVTRANEAVKRQLKTNKQYFLEDATLVKTAKISYSTEKGIPYLKGDANTREMFDAIADAVAKRAPLRSM